MKMKSRYVCTSCARRCTMLVSGSNHPTACAFGKDKTNWNRPNDLTFEKDDPWRSPYVTDDEYIAKLTEEQKNEIIRNHFDCKMTDGCPFLLDKDYKCEEWKAFCKLTETDGSEFDEADCMFRCNEHRCLTDYVLWKMKNGKNTDTPKD